MNKRNRQITMLVLATAFAAPVFADGRHGHDYYDYARVIYARPIYDTVQVMVPQQHCWTETGAYPLRPGAGLLGAIVGGTVGHQIGEGKGKRLATAAGAVIGARVAIDNQQRRMAAYGYGQPVQRCETQQGWVSEQRIVGYNVKYKYNGRVFRTRTDYDPGSTIRIRVDVATNRW